MEATVGCRGCRLHTTWAAVRAADRGVPGPATTGRHTPNHAMSDGRSQGCGAAPDTGPGPFAWPPACGAWLTVPSVCTGGHGALGAVRPDHGRRSSTPPAGRTRRSRRPVVGGHYSRVSGPHSGWRELCCILGDRQIPTRRAVPGPGPRERAGDAAAQGAVLRGGGAAAPLVASSWSRRWPSVASRSGVAATAGLAGQWIFVECAPR